MYIGAVFYHFKVPKVKDAVEVWKEHVLPDARKQSGFIGAELFIDEKTGKGFDIGYWETKEDADRYENAGPYGLLAERMKDFLVSPPRREEYRVMVKK